MRLRFLVLGLLVACLASFLLHSCNRDNLLTGNNLKLKFSVDTLTFDTVFTHAGQATRKFKIYNPYDQPVKINRIWLGGGSSSAFRVNIDGSTGPELRNVELGAKDSLYVFATAYIDPNNSNNPLIIFDSVMTDISGSIQKVILDAWGQDAVYIGRTGYLTTYSNQAITYTADKPYVLMGWVSYTNSSTLTIMPGAKIHMFGGPVSQPGQRGMLYIGTNSTLRILGIPSNPVVFSSHRLEQDFQNLPFQWESIYLSAQSKDNFIRGTVIRGAVYGIRVDSLSTNGNPKLDIRSSFIYNVAEAGILGVNGSIYAQNCIVANSNKYNLLLTYGGDYNFNQCTLVNYGTGLVDRTKPILLYKNYLTVALTDTRDTVYQASGSARFNNCIIYGTQRNEIMLDPLSNSSTPFSYVFDHCLLRVDTLNTNLVQCFKNKEPYFKDPNSYNFHIDSLISPVINTGKTGLRDYNNFPITDDFDGHNRDSQPDMGAYEF